MMKFLAKYELTCPGLELEPFKGAHSPLLAAG
jgi:hypothetical protein